MIPVDLPDSVLDGFTTLLDDGERRRLHATVLAAERRRYLAAHGAVRTILAGLTGVSPQRLQFEPGVNGKPALAGVAGAPQLNVSHSEGLCALAVTARPVGVDIQHLPPGLDPVAMAARRYPPEEARLVAGDPDPGGLFIRLWARKEACVKAAAGTLMQGMHLPVVGGSPLRVARPGGPLPGPFLVTDLPVPDGYHAAVAVNGDDPYDVVCRWWPDEEP